MVLRGVEVNKGRRFYHPSQELSSIDVFAKKVYTAKLFGQVTGERRTTERVTE